MMLFAIAEGQLKLFIAQDNSNGELFIQPLRDIQRILERSVNAVNFRLVVISNSSLQLIAIHLHNPMFIKELCNPQKIL